VPIGDSAAMSLRLLDGRVLLGPMQYDILFQWKV